MQAVENYADSPIGWECCPRCEAARQRARRMSDQCCDMMRNAVEEDDIPLYYQPRFRSWVLEQQDGLGTRWQIQHCPWCGIELPAALSEEWLAEASRRGIGPLAEDDDLPADLRDDRWWKALGL